MVTAKDVKELREKTGAGMMDCKKALTECDGDMAKAIDWLREKGIAKAAKKADRIAAEGLSRCLLYTSMPLPGCKVETIDLVKGDQKSVSIAAASILAKVTRDHIMMGYDHLYPQYGFARHKGYGTKEHLAALEKYGVLPIHRQSYAPVARMNQLQLEL